MSTSSLWPLLAFAVVVALIPLSLWAMKRAGLGGAPQGNLLRTLSSLSLSPSQKVVVVELAQGASARWLVLGVGADHITPLAQMDAPAGVPVALSQPHAPVAAQLLERFRQARPGNDHA